MIDWITAIIPCHHDEKIYGGTIASVNIDGEIEWRVEKKKQIRGSNESNLNIKSLDNTEILLDGNLAKWLQGHNMFGSDDLIGLVNAVMHRLIPILGLTPDEYDLSCWEDGIYMLKHVDCTAMWELPRRGDVRDWLRAAEMQSKSRHGRPITTGSTLYFGKNSRRWSIKFYAKGDEIEAMFSSLAIRANNSDTMPKLEIYMRLALKAQAQCARTIEVIAAMKNPPVIFAKQANISNGNQQVNNNNLTKCDSYEPNKKELEVSKLEQDVMQTTISRK